MNKLLLLPVLALFGSLSAQAAYVQGGILDESRGVVQLTVSYGGCHKQEFRLEHSDFVAFSSPPQMSARIVSEPSGPCRMAFLEVVEFPLSDRKLKSLRGGATLTIYGDNDSSATVQVSGAFKDEITITQ